MYCDEFRPYSEIIKIEEGNGDMFVGKNMEISHRIIAGSTKLSTKKSAFTEPYSISVSPGIVKSITCIDRVPESRAT